MPLSVMLYGISNCKQYIYQKRKRFNHVTWHGTLNYSVWHIEAEKKWPPFRRRHFQTHFLNENIGISIKTSLKFVPKGLINNIPSLVPIMAWRRPGDKPLSEPMMVRSLTHICVTRPQWINKVVFYKVGSACFAIELNVRETIYAT